LRADGRFLDGARKLPLSRRLRRTQRCVEDLDRHPQPELDEIQQRGDGL
jgi:hypothetical protein